MTKNVKKRSNMHFYLAKMAKIRKTDKAIVIPKSV